MTFPTRNASDQPSLRYQLTHAPSGEHVGDMMPLLVTQPTPQGMGSALTYARRYSLCAVLNLVADVDDDGGQPAAPAKRQAKAKAKPAPHPLDSASDQQRKKIHVLLKAEPETTRDELQQIVAPWGIDARRRVDGPAHPGRGRHGEPADRTADKSERRANRDLDQARYSHRFAPETASSLGPFLAVLRLQPVLCGRLSHRRMDRKRGALAHRSGHKAAANVRERARLRRPMGAGRGGWQIHDYGDYQRSFEPIVDNGEPRARTQTRAGARTAAPARARSRARTHAQARPPEEVERRSRDPP